LDDEPLITPEILRLTKWTSDYYASFWGEMLKASLPAGINSEKLRPKRRKAVRLIRGKADTPVEFSRVSPQAAIADKSVRAPTPLTSRQQQILATLEENGGK